MTIVARIALSVFLATPFLASGQALESPVRYTSFVQGKALYHLVAADLSGENVSVETRCADRLMSVAKILGSESPTVALTGTFFAWENQRPVGDVVVDGALVAQGRRGSVLAVDWFGKVHIFHPRFREHVDWFPYRFALRAAVRLVENSKVVPNPRAQKFRDKSIWGKAARSAVGVTPQGKLLIIATKSPVSLSQLGWALVGKGATDAVCLDGGGSTTLHYRGKAVVPTSRRLSNLLVVFERSPFDQGYQTHLTKVAKKQTDGLLKAIGRKTP